MAHSGLAQIVRSSPFSVPSVTMASVNVAALEVLDQLRFECLSVGQRNDADGDGIDLGHECGAVAARSGNDLEAMVGDWPDEQGRQPK
jgi:hypothetical protein